MKKNQKLIPNLNFIENIGEEERNLIRKYQIELIVNYLNEMMKFRRRETIK